MYNAQQMKTDSMVLLLLATTFAWASEPVALSLPSVAHADTEVVTNVPLPSLSHRAAKFGFSLGCRATPTNNVEIAFGTDTDSDGVLSPRETRLVVGWDSGSWFVRRGFAGERFVAWSSSTDEVKTLSWEMTLGLRAAPCRLVVREEVAPLDFELPTVPQNWLFNSDWNLMRLIGRGLDVQNESFNVQFMPESFTVILR